MISGASPEEARKELAIKKMKSDLEKEQRSQSRAARAHEKPPQMLKEKLDGTLADRGDEAVAATAVMMIIKQDTTRGKRRRFRTLSLD